MRFSKVCLLAASLLWARPASADCTNPPLPQSSVFYNQDYNVLQYCNGTDWIAMGDINPSAGSGTCANPAAPEASMIYNSDYSVMQFCNGQDWIAIGPYTVLGGGLAGPSGCANIGDLCADGTVFAGWHPITQEHLFIPTTDQGTTSQWNTSTGTNDIATDSTYDGRVNTNQVENSTTFPAFKLCKDLGTGGHSDWYLPSQVEFYYLWSVHDTIEAGGNITNFQSAHYWSSTEYSTLYAWYHGFAGGYQSTNSKTNTYRVRCVRR